MTCALTLLDTISASSQVPFAWSLSTPHSGKLRAGTQLSEPDLAKQLGMSRTPVREALRQMENEGSLDYAPRFGAMVRVPERDELGEMYALGEAPESHAVAEAAQNISPPDLEKLADAFEQMCEIGNRFRGHNP